MRSFALRPVHVCGSHHANLFPFRAWTDAKTKDIINCLYKAEAGVYGKGRYISDVGAPSLSARLWVRMASQAVCSEHAHSN